MLLESSVHRATAVGGAGIRRQCERGKTSCLRKRADAPDERIAVLVGKTDVADEDVGQLSLDVRQRFVSRGDGVHVGAIARQQGPDELARIGVVVDDVHANSVQRRADRPGCLSVR